MKPNTALVHALHRGGNKEQAVSYAGKIKGGRYGTQPDTLSCRIGIVQACHVWIVSPID